MRRLKKWAGGAVYGLPCLGVIRMHGLQRRLKRFFSALVYRVMLIGLPSSGRGHQDEREITVVCTAALGDFVVFCDVARALYKQEKPLKLVCRQGSGLANGLRI